jgi:hypothetical protein
VFVLEMEIFDPTGEVLHFRDLGIGKRSVGDPAAIDMRLFE